MSDRDQLHHADPLLGVQSTCRCGQVTYPTDAVWLAPGLALVTFPACDRAHQPGRHQAQPITWLIDSTPPPPATRCAATTLAGHPCRARPMHGRAWCYAHDPNRPQATWVPDPPGGQP